MSTNASWVIGGAIVAAAVIVSISLNQDAAPTEPGTGLHVDAEGTAHDAGDGAGHEPALRASTTDQQMAKLQRDLAAARDEIERMKQAQASGSLDTEAAEPTPAEHKQMAEHFFALGEAYSAGTATKAQVAELLKLSQDKKLMGRLVSDLEARIIENPDDLEARLQLIDVQSARVHSAESIVERGMLREGVQTQLTEVLKRDPENWDARYMRAVGISHSQRTPQGRARAVEAFESLITIQQSQPSEPRFAKTYGQLAGVLLAEKNTAKARETITAGLARYPDSEELRKMLDGLPKN